MANSPNRSRTIYQSLALYASQVNATGQQTGVSGVLPIPRTTNWDDSWSRNLTPVTVYGLLSPIDQLDVEAPDVTASFSYYSIDGVAEKRIGLTVTPSGSTNLVSCISGILNKTTDSKNYYLVISEEGYDMAGYVQPQTGCIALGNGTLAAWNLEGAVGSLLSASVELDGLNVAAYATLDGTQQVPAIIPASGTPSPSLFLIPQDPAGDQAYAGEVSAIQPGDMQLTVSGYFPYTLSNLQIQSFSLSVPLSRDPILKLGSKYPTSREITFPVQATLSVEAQFGSISDFNLYNQFCSGEVNAQIRLNKPSCNGGGNASLIVTLVGAKVQGDSASTSIDANGTATLEYTVYLGGATDTSHMVSISGSAPGWVL